MAEVAISPVVRAILTPNIDLSADEVITKAKARGVTAPDNSIRMAVHNIKSELRKKLAKAVAPAAPKLAPAAAHETKAPEAELAPAPKAVAAPAPAASAPAADLSAVLANVALVNTVMNSCGGVEPVRKVAEAVKACGGVEAFLQHVELVEGIRNKMSA